MFEKCGFPTNPYKTEFHHIWNTPGLTATNFWIERPLSQRKKEYAAWDVCFLLETYRFLKSEIEKVTKQAYDRLCQEHSKLYLPNQQQQEMLNSEKIFVFTKQRETLYFNPKDNESLSQYEPIVLKCSSEAELQLLLSKIPQEIVSKITQKHSDFVEFTLDVGKPIQVLFADDSKLILK